MVLAKLIGIAVIFCYDHGDARLCCVAKRYIWEVWGDNELKAEDSNNY